MALSNAIELGKISFRYAARMLFWTPIAFFSLLLVRNTLPYYSFNQQFDFIQERLQLFAMPMYAWSFYLHIGAGMFCISAALFQFSSEILKYRKKIHIWSGRIYVFVVLLIGAPTGLFMAFFAKGSIYERGLFVFMALAWFYTTYKGLSTVLKKNILAHKYWMYRSYALALTAVSFRILHLLFFILGWHNLENYQVSLWISVLGNMLLAEFFIMYRNKNYIKSFKN